MPDVISGVSILLFPLVLLVKGSVRGRGRGMMGSAVILGSKKAFSGDAAQRWRVREPAAGLPGVCCGCVGGGVRRERGGGESCALGAALGGVNLSSRRVRSAAWVPRPQLWGQRKAGVRCPLPLGSPAGCPGVSPGRAGGSWAQREPATTGPTGCRWLCGVAAGFGCSDGAGVTLGERRSLHVPRLPAPAARQNPSCLW